MQIGIIPVAYASNIGGTATATIARPQATRPGDFFVIAVGFSDATPTETIVGGNGTGYLQRYARATVGVQTTELWAGPLNNPSWDTLVWTLSGAPSGSWGIVLAAYRNVDALLGLGNVLPGTATGGATAMRFPTIPPQSMLPIQRSAIGNGYLHGLIASMESTFTSAVAPGMRQVFLAGDTGFVFEQYHQTGGLFQAKTVTLGAGVDSVGFAFTLRATVDPPWVRPRWLGGDEEPVVVPPMDSWYQPPNLPRWERPRMVVSGMADIARAE